MFLTISEIQDGLRAEAADLPESLSFKVVASKRFDDLWSVELDPETGIADNGKRNVVLDEALEGARAWWAGPPKGKAGVLAVIPEEAILLLSDVTEKPPVAGQWLKIYTQDYLQILRDIWRRPDWSANSVKYQKVLSEIKLLPPLGIVPDIFPMLRSAQRRAFDLINFEVGFLWGPPGTGKTTTLGALMAGCVVQKPELRILLVGTTNQAVDQALVAADKALEKLGAVGVAGRKRLCRFGSRFHADHYKGRDHLIPIQDKSLLVKLRKLESEKPESEAPQQLLAKWHQERQQLKDRIRSQMSQLFRDKSVIAMTATRAAFALDDLEFQKKFDLLVFDEASQLGLANTLCLMPLADRFLFAGDDKQLSPVVTSINKKAVECLGKSPFKYKGNSVDRQNLVMLDEQSRMAEAICYAVSEAYYFGKLKVAEDSKRQARWLAERHFSFGNIGKDVSLKCLEIADEGVWSQKYRGLVRLPSAEKIADLIGSALKSRHISAEDVVVLTPFRAQRILIKRCLYHREIKGVKVSTVHRSQGSEAKVVIFDPVKGNEDFLTNSEGARLINVALSRAMGKLILVLSPGDRKNPQLAQFHALSNIDRKSTLDALELKDLLRKTRKRQDIEGKVVRHGRHIGKVKAFDQPPGLLIISSHVTGQDHEFELKIIYDNIFQ